MSERVWKVYLSGEIHSDWREQIAAGVTEMDLPVELCAPITVHDDSDDCGVAIFGAENSSIWHDRKGARLNAIRNRTLMADADIVVVRFGEKYKQWSAAFDAGCAVTLGKPIITLHPSGHDHAMKEIDAAANAVAREPAQVVQALAYVIRGDMPASTKEAYAAE